MSVRRSRSTSPGPCCAGSVAFARLLFLLYDVRREILRESGRVGLWKIYAREMEIKRKFVGCGGLAS
jgi:hypothetical protein